jgi:hypothetical protein
MAKMLALLLILILAVSTIGAWFAFNQNDNRRQESDEYNLSIRDFSASGWGNPAGVTMMVFFNISIANNGTCDVANTSLEIKRSNLESDPFNITKPLGILHKGDTIEIQDIILAINMNLYFDEFYNSSFVAHLKHGDFILDERVVQITSRQF